MSNVALHHVHALHENDCARRQYRAPATVLSERSHSFLSKSCRPFSATISRPMREHHSSAVSSCVRCSATSSSTSSVTLYPAGKKQARVKIPACFLKVSVQDALSATSAQVLDEAIGAGITGVWLVDEGNEGVCLAPCSRWQVALGALRGFPGSSVQRCRQANLTPFGVS